MKTPTFLSRLKCTFSQREDELSHYSINYGNFERKKPSMVVWPNNSEEIRKIMSFAFRSQLSFTIRGSGHSLNDASLTSGILILTEKKSKALYQISDTSFEVDTSYTWGEIEKSFNSFNRSFPVITSELDTTIGGTLSTGGFGEGSVKYGSQIYLVKSMKLILPSGIRKTCSRQKNVEIFRTVLAGWGQLGYIDTVTLETVPYSKDTKLNVFKFSRLESVIVAIKDISQVSKPDYLSCRKVDNGLELLVCYNNNYSQVDLDRIVVSLGGHKQFDENVTDFSIRSLGKRRSTQWSQNYSYIFSDHIVPVSAALEFGDYLEKILNVLKIKKFRLLILSGFATEMKFPFLSVDQSIPGIHIGFGLYIEILKDDKIAFDNSKQMSRLLTKMAIKVSGRPYLTNSFTPTTKELLSIYKNDLTQIKELKAKYDPSYLCNYNFFTKAIIEHYEPSF